MAEQNIFVGRKAELVQFEKVLAEPSGQAVLVVGQAGMGKTWLVNKMTEIAQNHHDLKCGWVRYEVTPTDSVDSTMALMMDEACETAEAGLKAFLKLKGRPKQWSALFSACGLIPIVGNKVKALGELVLSLRRESTKDTRTQFIRKLHQISEKMAKDRRAIFIIDPEKYMQKESDQSWAIVVKNLPEKVKFVFAQRPEDVLVDSETFGALDNVARIPEQRLGVLEEEAVDDLLEQRAGDLEYSVTEVRKILNRYEGHPYAIGAALDLLEAGTKLEQLPQKPEPTKFAQVQWENVKQIKHGSIELFEAYTVLEVGVPDDVVEAVSGLKPAERKGILGETYLKGLLREEGAGRRIYHAILADYILGQIGEAEAKGYHGRAVQIYRRKLADARKAQTCPDALAAARLPEHVLAAEDEKAFVYAFVNECYPALRSLGLLDTAINVSERALEAVEKGSEEEAAVLGNLGVIYGKRGELDKAEEMHIKSLEITEKLGSQEGMASGYGNLGLIYETRGELDKAEQMHKRSLEIGKRLGTLEVMASEYGNLGLIYRKRGELDNAEQMHKKSLEVDEKLGLQEGMASDYGNLGLIYQMKGELEKAEEIHKKSLEIEEKLGRLEGIAREYGNLGVIYRKRGELNKAEEMFLKSLEISEPDGMRELTANQYVNLGLIYEQRGDVAKTRECWQKARDLYEKIGMPHKVKKVEGLIDGLKKKGSRS
jgi:tetratricopeptide (TPR) repeat protein/energy-coupling factor transporter ATP-binding protein EcfA2